MSAPARALPDRPSTTRRPPSRRTGPSDRAGHRRGSLRVSRPARTGAGFWVVAGLMVVLLVLGLVSLNALAAQSSFRLDDLGRKTSRLSRQLEDRRLDVARLSAPSRIAREAKRLGLRLPDPASVVYLHAPLGPSGATTDEAASQTAGAGGSGTGVNP